MILNHGNRIRLMTFTSLLIFLMVRWRLLVACATLLLVFGLLWRMPYVASRTPEAEDTSVGVPAQELDVSVLREYAGVFRPAVITTAVDASAAWDDYRFAGTFFLYEDDGTREASMRRAIISYQPDQRQYVVSEGDQVGPAEVVRIRSSEVLLRSGDEESILPLRGRATTADEEETAEVTTDDADDDPVEQTRFGELTEAGTWQMDREALLAYYEELLDEPERLLQVFDSMQPIYTDDGSIEGYQLEPVGEAAFFEAVGFEEGDRVRAVNTLPMTNRRRAEFFIRQVVENELDSIVIDLERGDSEERLVYEIR